MNQQPLEFPKRFKRTKYLQVVDDYGPVGQGVSQARTVLAENGEEYIIKGPTLCSVAPYVAANELIAVELAAQLGLPVLDRAIVSMGGDLFFASAHMTKGTFFPHTTEDLFNGCENRDRVYDLVAFDSWVCNGDRHEGNLLVRDLRGRRLLLLNDHSHCLCHPGLVASHLSSRLGTFPNQYVRLDYVRDAIVDRDHLYAAVQSIMDLDTEIVRSIVRSTPSEWLSSTDSQMFEEFLLNRQVELGDRFSDDMGFFHRLRGAA